MIKKVIYLALIALICNISSAGVTATGDYAPSDLESWASGNSAEKITVGKYASGEIAVDGAGYEISCNILEVAWQSVAHLSITDGAQLNYYGGYIGMDFGGDGCININGDGSKLSSGNGGSLSIGSGGVGEMNITGSGFVDSLFATIGMSSFGEGVANVSGVDSEWLSGVLTVGNRGTGQLNISDAGLVTLGSLAIDKNGQGNSFVNMSTDGMLKIGGTADSSILDYLELVNGSGSIRYWNGSGWSDIAGASQDVYTLEHIVETYVTDWGETETYDYTILTVHSIPEPASLVLLGVGALALRQRAKRKF